MDALSRGLGAWPMSDDPRSTYQATEAANMALGTQRDETGLSAMNDPLPRPKDMSWARFLGVFGVILIVAALLIPVPSRGPGGIGLVPADCLPSLLTTVVAGVLVVVLTRSAISRKRSGYYSTPRRDIAITSLVLSAALSYLWPLACFP